MGKKKGKSGSKAPTAAENTSPTAQAQDVESPPALAAEASGAPSPEPSMLDAAPSLDARLEAVKDSPQKASSSSSEVDDLRRELDACKKQIAKLQAQNAALVEENQRLKSSQSSTVTAQAPLVSAGPDFEALTQRIAALKAEQAEADAAREAAWSQLKSVVADIARLAAPDAVAKAGTPTATTNGGFGAAA